jgi:hypothetical protein
MNSACKTMVRFSVGAFVRDAYSKWTLFVLCFSTFLILKRMHLIDNISLGY